MPLGKILFLVFLLVPLAEIYVLIQVGDAIGALPTIALVVLTAVVGATLIRAQGLVTLTRVRAATERGELPAMELFEGLCLLVAGALLLTPGFVTDSLGFLLLIPGLRRAMIQGLIHRGVIRAAERRGRAGVGPGAAGTGPEHGPVSGAQGPGRVIEGEFERKE